MNEWSVLAALREMTVLEDGAASQALPLCRSALQTLVSRLKDGADPADSRLIRAAAGLAYYKWTLRNASLDDGITHFKAGDVTVSRSYSAALDYAVCGTKASLTLCRSCRTKRSCFAVCEEVVWILRIF